MSPRELLSLTVMVVLMPWLSDKNIEVRALADITENESQRGFKDCFQ